MSKNHFVSHFLPFQINTTIFIFVNLFTKWLPAAILDVRKSLSVAFLAISDQYETLIFNFYKMASGPTLYVRNSLSIAFLAISDRSAILDFRNSRSIANSGHFRLIQNSFFPAAILDV